MRYLIFVLLFIYSPLLAQSKKVVDPKQKIKPANYLALQVFEDSLEYYGAIMVKDTVPEQMEAACVHFTALLKAALAVENSFYYPFSCLENISILAPDNNKFRIFSWQLFRSKEEYQYFGFVQMDSRKLKLFELNDESRNFQKPESAITDAQKWHGALYYRLMEHEAAGNKKYLLFGYNRLSYTDKRKVVEVLTFKNGEPSFGSPIFETVLRGKKTKWHRIVVDYSAQTDIRLNYNEDEKMIIHDHLEIMGSAREDQPYMLVPDGTYEAWELRKGIWTHIEMLANTPLKEAPRPRPVLGKKRDIFGN